MVGIGRDTSPAALTTKWIRMRDVDSVLTLTPASGSLGQARDGGEQDQAEHPAHHAHRGKDKTLPAGQAFAFGIVEERASR